MTASNITTSNLYNTGNSNVNDVYIRAAGKWASQMGGGAGLSSLLSPLKGDFIGCSAGGATAYAQVTTSGALYTRVIGVADSGWVIGPLASDGSGYFAMSSIGGVTLDAGGALSCAAVWPG